MAYRHPKGIPTTRSILLNSFDIDDDLRARLDYCGVPARWGWNFCRTAGCQRCRKHRAEEWIAETRELFRGVPATRLRWVTTMLEPCATPGEVAERIKKGKIAWRNIVHRFRGIDVRAHGLRAIGVAETDWYAAQHISKLGSNKQKFIEGSAFCSSAPEVWLPHFHLLINLNGASEAKLSEMLERKWPGPAAVKFKMLNPEKFKDQNIRECLEYATKARHYYRIRQW